VSFSAAVITVSDASSAGTREDASGPRLVAVLETSGYQVGPVKVIPDDEAQIEAALKAEAARGTNLVLTTGGTGFGPRDVTPEATKRAIEKDAPGLGELMRAEGLRHTPMAALSRGIAGSRDKSLIVNLPGSPKGAEESLRALLEVLPHALQVLSGDTSRHPPHRATQ
jgi:molybdopterin adenylyltransferase